MVSIETEVTGLATVGFAFSLLWFLTAMGRERYIRRWRAIVERVDAVVDPHGIYADIEQRAKRDPLNPSIIFVYVPALICLAWIGIYLWLR